MKSTVFALLVLGGVIANGCADDSTSTTDPLGGVNDATASQLCVQINGIADAVTVAQRIDDSGAAQTAASAYEALAAQAKKSGARHVAALAYDAVDAARDLAQAKGAGSAADELVTIVLRLQLSDTSLRLACAEHGHSIFSPGSTTTATR